LGEETNYGKAVEDVALPDALSFAGPDEATLDTCSDEELRVGGNLLFSLRKVALNQGFT
jgi:hypothetical protein